MKRLQFVRRRFTTLLEMIIAMGLVSILLTTLLGIYSQIDETHVLVDKVRQENFNLRYVQSHLAAVITEILPPSADDFYFYLDPQHAGTKGPSLVFTYDNGVDLDPDFASDVIGRLYVDNRGQLCLATWPSPQRWDKGNAPVKKEVLLDNVSSLAFAFYVPPLFSEKVIETERIEPGKEKKDPNPGEWNTEWPMQYAQLPVMVRLQITRSVAHGSTQAGERISFVYPIKDSDKPLIYYK